jgi:hypothetical protein
MKAEVTAVEAALAPEPVLTAWKASVRIAALLTVTLEMAAAFALVAMKRISAARRRGETEDE